ncbi:MAG TPA: mechanosensitive ion channel domain-containing protein [Stellaceae bacterium]|nr:mechanosensitive ion channel domain-containing protein [Stellaceae bacterium]
MKRLLIALIAALTMLAGPARADAPDGMPQMSGWIEQSVARFEAEATSDVMMAPDVFSAIGREWRSLDRNGSAAGVLADLAWVAVAALIALAAEGAIIRVLSRRARHRIRTRETSARLVDVLGLVASDIAGLAGFVLVFHLLTHRFLLPAGITASLAMFASAVLVRWRIMSLILRAILRPHDAAARLIELPDGEALRMARMLSALVLAIILLVGFGRYGLMDDDSGAPHVLGLLIAMIVFPLYGIGIVYARRAGEALVRGRRKTGMIAIFREALARAWVPVGLLLVTMMFVFFVAGLSLGLLRYSQAVYSTLGVLFVVLVLDRLTEWEWAEVDSARGAHPVEGVAARAVARILRGIGIAVGAALIAWLWIDAIEPSAAVREAAMRSASAAVATLLVALIAWELVRLAIDRHLEEKGAGPALPGAADDDEEVAPASRLQTVLPLLRAAFAVVIGVLAALIVLSRLGVDTAPLIAGAGVFGLAVSFGSQSLVRDIISGLFYMWDDAFRVGEYIDTGRLKGTVETLGVRSVKLRHQNGPLHTIPYGQLGAVTNLSRDFATIKFNLRFEPSTDIETVRKATKQIGLSMQEENAELATEVMLPLKLQGIAEVVDNALVLRFKFTARPVKPSWVQREYLKRMYQVFAEKGIQFATGTTLVLQHMPPPPFPDVGQTAATGVASVAAIELAEAAVIPAAAG